MASADKDHAGGRPNIKRVTLSEFEEEQFEAFGSFARTEINMCERAATYLVAAIQRCGPGPIRADPEEEVSVGQLRLGAMLGIAIRMVRAMRAALAVLSVGYEVEGGVYDRLLLELHGRMAQIADDASGEVAHRWLRGEAPSRIGRIWSNSTMRNLYANLSSTVHADSRIFGYLFESSVDALLIGPRRTHMTRVSMLAQSVVAYDAIVRLSRETGITIEGTDVLLTEIGHVSLALEADLDR